MSCEVGITNCYWNWTLNRQWWGVDHLTSYRNFEKIVVILSLCMCRTDMGHCKKFLAPGVICGPSGTGKGKLIRMLMREFPRKFELSILINSNLGEAYSILNVYYNTYSGTGLFSIFIMHPLPNFWQRIFSCLMILQYHHLHNQWVLSTFILVSWIAALLSSKLEFSVICYRDVWFSALQWHLPVLVMWPIIVWSLAKD